MSKIVRRTSQMSAKPSRSKPLSRPVVKIDRPRKKVQIPEENQIEEEITLDAIKLS